MTDEFLKCFWKFNTMTREEELWEMAKKELESLSNEELCLELESLKDYLEEDDVWPLHIIKEVKRRLLEK